MEILTDVRLMVVEQIFGTTPDVVTIRGGTVGVVTFGVSHQIRIEFDRDVFVLFGSAHDLPHPHPFWVRRVTNDSILVEIGAELPLTRVRNFVLQTQEAQ